MMPGQSFIRAFLEATNVASGMLAGLGDGGDIWVGDEG